MCDAFVEELLRRWGVPQLLDRCKEQELDLEALRSLEEEVIAELVPLIGPRCKFRKAWRAWVDAGAPVPAGPAGPAPGQQQGPARSPPSSSPAAAPSGCDAHDTPSASMSAAAPSSVPWSSKRSKPTPPAAPGESQPSNSHDQVDVRKEVSVYLEGKIVYEGDPSSGWLVAEGQISKTGSPWEQRFIKTEPAEDVLPEMEPMAGRQETSSSKGPRFQLQGRISLSLQDFAEVPSFMLSTMDENCAMSEGQQQFFQQMQQDTENYSMVGPSYSAPEIPEPVSAPLTRRPKRSRSDKMDLESLLNSSSKGKMILSLYQQRGSLDGPARQTLTDLVIAEELREDLNMKITSQRFQEIAEQIVEVFPGENVDTYYCNDRSLGDRPGGKGKLTSKYYNTRRQLAKTGVICRGANKDRKQIFQQGTYAALECTPQEEDTALKNIRWLQSLGWHSELSLQDVDMAFEKWQGSWKTRFLRIFTQGHQPLVYLDTFPILRMPIGEKLVRADFDNLFKHAGNRMIGYWAGFSQSIFTMMAEDYRKSIPLLDHVKRNVVTAEGKQIGALLLLPSLLPVTTCKGSTDSSELWRPTRQEAQDGFLLHVKEDSDVSGALERHFCRMRLLGHPVSPLPVIVGQSLDKLQTAFVAIDENTAFYVSNGVHAVDLCFKCFHALQVAYPPQAQNVWLFLQHAVYQVATPTDRVSVAVNSLLADFGFRPMPSVASWDQVLNG